MIFYCDICDEFFNEEDVVLQGDNLTDIPCPGCCMPMSTVNTDEPYDTLEEKLL